MNTKRFSMIKKVLCMVAFAMLMSSPAFAVKIDGNVEGSAEGYTSEFNVSFDIEGGPFGVPGGSLFTHETADTMYYGLILPLSIVDNTYGDTKATDWGTIEHYLWGGGDGLEGSDKWELKVGKDLKLELDYIVGETVDNPDSWSAEIKKEEGINALEFHTSLDYNYNELGLTELEKSNYFGPELGDGYYNSPGPAPWGTPVVYEFDAPAADWIPEIMYEFSVEKGEFDWFDLESSTIIHASPNKLGGHKLFPKYGDPIPEPATMLLLGSGLVGLAVLRRKFRKS